MTEAIFAGIATGKVISPPTPVKKPLVAPFAFLLMAIKKCSVWQLIYVGPSGHT